MGTTREAVRRYAREFERKLLTALRKGYMLDDLRHEVPSPLDR